MDKLRGIGKEGLFFLGPAELDEDCCSDGVSGSLAPGFLHVSNAVPTTKIL